MTREHIMRQIVKQQKAGVPKGICSICSANSYVLEAALEHGLETGGHVLIEATCNQVNQFGGYTGMKPADFQRSVLGLADKVGFPRERMVLGGDHLGPNPWKNEPAEAAMEKSAELIRQYVMAGFTKLHIDCSMALGDDVCKDGALDPAVIAERTAELCQVAEEAYKELLCSNPDAVPPVYVIGTEVPVPGGMQEEEDGLQVTRPEDLKETVRLSREAFLRRNLHEAWERVVAVVVQPGVEFGSSTICEYDREKAKGLTAALAELPSLVFEGHSTDYQTQEALKGLVEDGVAILKVGPALTFALREGLLALSLIEKELLGSDCGAKLSNLMEKLDAAMLSNPAHWRNYYRGSEADIALARKYSFSDRCRYYWAVPEVKEAVEILMANLSTTPIPITLISQYLPVQYKRIRAGLVKIEPEALVKDKIKEILEDYESAINP
ncbi:MAG: D-tagatose-bisphosphate aldolase, class II, non-catalytic subunit [Firmicutes bacterium]|nr:D-tagatose-bisphosphate aldolase, class II, non-catalytic subunit [Bacillota bacterium]